MNILFFLKPKSEVAYVTGNSTIRQGIEKLKAHIEHKDLEIKTKEMLKIYTEKKKK